jgi:hypothetical protein
MRQITHGKYPAKVLRQSRLQSRIPEPDFLFRAPLAGCTADWIAHKTKKRAKKLQPPEAVWHSEGCCSPQNNFKVSHPPNERNAFLKKSASTL